METVGLIAGNGTFPLLFARAARARGITVVAVAHRGETPSELEEDVAAITWIRVGQIGKAISVFKKAGVKQAVMAGGVDKSRSLLSVRPDWRGLRLLRRAVGRGDDALLRAVAAELESEGIAIVPSTVFLAEIVVAEGRLAGPPPSPVALADVRYGYTVLTALGDLDIGQCAVVENGVVLAIEAIEGTDAAIRRGGGLGTGKAVVVKASKPGQDLRFDVPAVGPATIETMVKAGAKVLALQAGRTIMLEGERTSELARRHRVSVLGFGEGGLVRGC